ncbi:PIN domain nuclease [Spirosoma montaniterrae]|uniref:Ribonuclease VapC n=1 Tax=Spirosoma montaniterrae TaxID=1178516 RepID=A0A1P9WWU7_9BACT|nr:PIN domain nuclease [Spirosoma montaniterrae]AQG79856.1 twitching motility protein PilT [Spirosoma montaniterrae]
MTEPIIVDTSVWIDCFRGISTNQTKIVIDRLLTPGLIAITPTILQETLQGFREDNEWQRARTNLLACKILRADAIKAAIGAAQLYRSLRKKGVTIRKPNDCLIAHYALFYDLPILHNDADFDQIARHTTLRVA